MRAAVVVFPGSNCDRDLAVALRRASGLEPARVWHRETELPPRVDLVAIPGGFSFGDYLRCGAIAARAPVMEAVRAHARAGGLTLGVCNGFQILVESGLLPGAFLPNDCGRFVCREATLRVDACASPFTSGFRRGELVQIPVAHADGAYHASPALLEQLEGEERIAFRYASQDGAVSREANPNGSVGSIAGVLSPNRRLLGMMPHPERAADPDLGGTDGARLLAGLVDAVAGGA